MFFLAICIIQAVFRTIHVFNRISRRFVKGMWDYVDDFLQAQISKYKTTAISNNLSNQQKDHGKPRNSEECKTKSDVSRTGNSCTKGEYFKTVATKFERNKSLESNVVRSLDAMDYEVLVSKMQISNLNICFNASDIEITSKLNKADTITVSYKISRENSDISPGDYAQKKVLNSTNDVESEEKTSVKLEPPICITVCNSDINKEVPRANKITEPETNNSRAGGKENDIINSYNIPLKFDILEPKTVNHTTDFSKTITVKNHDENLKSVDSKETEIPYSRFFQEKKQCSDNFSFVRMEPENSGETALKMDGFELREYERHLNACNVSSETTCRLPTKENTECLKNGPTLASQMNESPKMSRESKKLFSKDLNALTLGADNPQNKNKILEENIDLTEGMFNDTQARNEYDPICNLEMSYESQLNNNEVETKDLLCTTAVCDSETRASTPNDDFKGPSRKIPIPIESSKEKSECPEREIVSSSEDMNVKSCTPLPSVQHERKNNTGLLNHSTGLVDCCNKSDTTVRSEFQNSKTNVINSATSGANNSLTKPSKEICSKHEGKPATMQFYDERKMDKVSNKINFANTIPKEVESNSNNITNSTTSAARDSSGEMRPAIYFHNQGETDCLRKFTYFGHDGILYPILLRPLVEDAECRYPSDKISSQCLENKEEMHKPSSTSFDNTIENNSGLTANQDNAQHKKMMGNLLLCSLFMREKGVKFRIRLILQTPFITESKVTVII